MWLWLALVGCVKPTLVSGPDGPYDVEAREPQTFMYVDYRWGLGPFDDATALEEAVARLAAERGELIEAVARFPTLRDWQLGAIVRTPLEVSEIGGRPVHVELLPAGRYARLHTVGHVDTLFRRWGLLERMVAADGEAVEGPVMEVYPDLLTGTSHEEMRGEVRYRLATR